MNVLLGLVIMVSLIIFNISFAYTLGITYYPDGCCDDIGSWLILTYLFGGAFLPLILITKLDEDKI